MSRYIPTSEDLAQAMLDTIDGNDYDDGLDGWWSSDFLRGNEESNTYSIKFHRDDEDGDLQLLAEWEITLAIRDVSSG